MKKQEITISYKKSVSYIFCMLFFVSLTISSIFYNNVHILIKVFLSILNLFFVIGIYSLIKILRDKSKMLIIGDLGIEDNFTNPSIGLISWCDIIDIQINKYYGSKMLVIYTHDPNKYLEKIPTNKRKGLNNNNNLIGTPFAIPIKLFNKTENEILDYIERYYTPL